MKTEQIKKERKPWSLPGRVEKREANDLGVGTSRSATRARKVEHSDQEVSAEDSWDEWEAEAAQDLAQYEKEREIEEERRKTGKKRRRSKRPRRSQAQKDNDFEAGLARLSVLLDPNQQQLPLEEARALIKRAAASAERATKDTAHGLTGLAAKLAYEEDSDPSQYDTEDDLPEGIGIPAVKVEQKPIVTEGASSPVNQVVQPQNGHIQLEQARASCSTAPRYRPLIVGKMDAQTVEDSDEEEEEDMLAPRKPAVTVKTKVKDEEEEEEEILPINTLSQFTSSQSRQSQVASVKTESGPQPTSDTETSEDEIIFTSTVKKGQSVKEENRPSSSGSRKNAKAKFQHMETDLRPAFALKPGDDKIGPLVLDENSDIKVPASINCHLRDYQREGIQFLWEAYRQGHGAILGDDMGLGKTVQVLGFLAAIMKKCGGSRDLNRRVDGLRFGRVDYRAAPDSVWPTCLILCPQTVIGNWQAEIQTWGYFEHAVYGSGYRGALEDFRRGRLDIVIASHEYAREHIDSLWDLPWSCIFADEAHKFKNPDSAMTEAMNAFQCQVRFALSGTVVQNRVHEMWTLLDWTNPGKVADLEMWKLLIVNPMKIGQRKNASEEEVKDSRLIAELLSQNLCSGLMLRRTKALIADQLPKKYDKIVFCPLSAEQLQAYRKLTEQEDVINMVRSQELCECGATDGAGLPYLRGKCCFRLPVGEILRTIHLMSCLANHAALFFPDPYEEYDDREEVRERFDKQTEYTKRLWPDTWPLLKNNQENGFRQGLCGKWHVLVELMRSWFQQKDKVLLFSRSLRLLDWLSYWVELSGYKHLRLDGSTPQSQRQAKVNTFNQDPTYFIFLISTTAGGTGLNLTGANKVVIFDPNWNPAHDMQAMDRAYRFGQTRDVNVFRLVGAGTLEEIIYSRQIYKLQTANMSYTGNSERRFFNGVEGVKSHQGELFGLKNMFTLREDTCSITKEIIQDCNVDESAMDVKNFQREVTGGKAGEDGIIYGAGIDYTHDHGKVMALPPNTPKKKRQRSTQRSRRERSRQKSEDGDDDDDGSPKQGKAIKTEGVKVKTEKRAAWPPPRPRAR
ncbi:unnamed protein product [Sympodiomycopsis kandeliae]